MPYLNTRQLVRIWFSNHKAIFLPPQNQTRFARLREQNPEANILLVTNSSFLCKEAQNALLLFCEQNRIDIQDFDAFKTNLKSDDERTLYNLAQEELRKALNNEGGNLGAASDIARILWVARGYFYSDFDTELTLSALAAQHPLPDSTPFWITNLYELCGEKESVTFLCNDIIAPTSDDPKLIAEFLHYFAEEFCKRYQNPLAVFQKKEQAKLFLPFLIQNNLNNLFEIRKQVDQSYALSDWQKAMGAPTKSALVECIRAKIRHKKDIIQWVEKPLYHLDLPDSELIYRWYCLNKEQFLEQSVISFSGSSVWGDLITTQLSRRFSSLLTLFPEVSIYSLATYHLMPYCHSTQSYGLDYKVSPQKLQACLERCEKGAIRDASWMSSPLDALREIG